MTKPTIFMFVTFFGIVMAFLGVKYVLKNQKFELSQKEANAGNLIAQYNMGLMYFKGDGVLQNYQEAFKWFYKAAQQGSASSQYYIGLMYQNGFGVAQNDQEARKWFEKSAAQNNKLTQEMLLEK